MDHHGVDGNPGCLDRVVGTMSVILSGIASVGGGALWRAIAGVPWLLRAVLLTMALFVFTACGPAMPGGRQGGLPEIDGERALRLTAELAAIRPRHSGTSGAAEAAAWLRDQCAATGCEVRIDVWDEQTPAGMTTFRNVIATRPGKIKKRVLLGSHYDTKYLPEVADFVGANDSASSSALLLELMRVMVAYPETSDYSLEFVFFDGEECRVRYSVGDGLHGSRRHAEQIAAAGRVGEYAAMILLDMIGDKDLTVTIPLNTDRGLARRVLQIAERRGVRKYFGYYPQGIIDDHVPFAEVGMPVVNLIDFEYGPDNRYWHTAEDTLDKLSATSLKIVGEVVVELLSQSL